MDEDFPDEDFSKRVSNISTSTFLEVFRNELEKFSGGIASLSLRQGAKQVFYKPRSVPIALREKVEYELIEFVKSDVLKPVEFCDWATPIMLVLNKNGRVVRICGDLKITLNPELNTVRYPIARIENVLLNLSGCWIFSPIYPKRMRKFH